MKKKYIPYILTGSALLLFLLVPGVAASGTSPTVALSLGDILKAADTFIPAVESFSASPYWDVSRWSWGYGTAAPGSSGTITQAQALSDTNAVIQSDYADLAPQVYRNLTANQWVALLSFSYNEGIGNAYNLIDDINAGDDTVLYQHWMQYVYAAGVVNSTLVARRAKEWQLWQT